MGFGGLSCPQDYSYAVLQLLLKELQWIGEKDERCMLDWLTSLSDPVGLMFPQTFEVDIKGSGISLVAMAMIS